MPFGHGLDRPRRLRLSASLVANQMGLGRFAYKKEVDVDDDCYESHARRKEYGKLVLGKAHGR